MKKKPILVTDVDFVLLDWVYGLNPFLKEKGMPTDHLEQYRGSTYYPSLSELFFNENEDENLKLLHEFNNSEYIKHLPIFQEDSVKYLQNIAQEVDIYALTCLGTGVLQKESRAQNLRDHYGDIFKDTLCIPVRASKEPALRELQKKHTILHYVDDRIVHLKEAVDCKIDTILYKRNEEHPETEHYISNCWSDIENKTAKTLKCKITKSKKRINKP